MIKRRSKLAIAVLSVLVLMVFSGCSSKPSQPQYKLTLEVWGLFDDKDAFREIFNNYTQLNPNVTQINYRKLTSDTYEADLVEALASGQGPDIFLINNSWLPSFGDKISPAPPEIFGEQKARQNFVDVAAADFIDKGIVYAAPLSVDSLGLYYNKDLFNEAGVTAPPSDWNTFVEDARKMTRVDSSGQITQAGAAMGTAENINRSTDILVALMLQNGTEMTNAQRSQATFDKMSLSTADGVQNVSPGENALNFYTSFAKRSSVSYSWNTNTHYSVDAFGEGKLAMMLNYSWQRSAIASKSPKLNFDVAPLPQISGTRPVNLANYWGFAVSKNKIQAAPANGANKNQPPVSNDTRTKEAWKFLSYLTTKPEPNPNAAAVSSGALGNAGGSLSFDPAKKYAEITRNPAARRDIIELQKSDPVAGVFASQNLIAKSWYQVDPQTEESVLAEMIGQVNRGQATTTEALKSAAAKISLIMSRK